MRRSASRVKPKYSYKAQSYGEGESPFKKAIAILGIVVSVGIVGGILMYNTFSVERVKLDKISGCPVDGPRSVTVVLIDQTDQFTPAQRADIRNRLNEIKGGIPRYGMLSIFTIGRTIEKLPAPKIRVCNPGAIKEIDTLVESAIKASRKWEEVFDTPLNQLFEAVLVPHAAAQSPILENMQSVSVQEFGQDSRKNIKKRLVIISDFLQHSDIYSDYLGKGSGEDFFETEKFKKVRADLRDVDVELLYLQRVTKNQMQGPSHKKFWEKIIQMEGGTVSRIYPVSG